MKKVLVCVVAFFVTGLNSCKVEEFPGIFFSTYVSYDIIRDAGCEVYETDVPEGHMAIGYIREVCVAKYTNVESGTVYSVDRKILEHVAEVVKLKGGLGVANVNITITGKLGYPYIIMTGTIYK